MKLFRTMVIPAAALIFATAVPAQAQANASPVTLSGDVKAVKIVADADGVERVLLVDPGTIIPGDRLVFATDYANTGAEPVTDFKVTNPVPPAVTLAPDADPTLTVSVDGGETWDILSALQIINAEGTARSATHADVTHVRWVLSSIAPGTSGRLTYPAIIR